MITFRPILVAVVLTLSTWSATKTKYLPAASPNPCLLHEPVVVPHDELRLHLLHRVHRHADDDQQRRPAEEERHAETGREPRRQRGVEVLANPRNRRYLEPADQEVRQQRDDRQIDGS